jgi:hypothetical protein
MSKKKVGVLVDTVNNTIEDQYETHEQFMTRRGAAMAGMIGLLQSRLEIAEIELDTLLQFSNHPKQSLLYSVKSIREGVLETLIKFTNEWADMQRYDEGDYGKEMSERRLTEYTTKLETLKTLAL